MGSAGQALNFVQEYNLQGSVASGLPNLNFGRQNHACGHYIHNGQTVFIVAGGRGDANGLAVGGDRKRLDSTEILTRGASQWQFSGPLPRTTHVLPGATIDGNFIVAGE